MAAPMDAMPRKARVLREGCAEATGVTERTRRSGRGRCGEMERGADTNDERLKVGGTEGNATYARVEDISLRRWGRGMAGVRLWCLVLMTDISGGRWTAECARSHWHGDAGSALHVYGDEHRARHVVGQVPTRVWRWEHRTPPGIRYSGIARCYSKRVVYIRFYDAIALLAGTLHIPCLQKNPLKNPQTFAF